MDGQTEGWPARRNKQTYRWMIDESNRQTRERDRQTDEERERER